MMRAVDRICVQIWKIIYKPMLRRAARQILEGRLLDMGNPDKGRWLKSDVLDYLDETWERVAALLPLAKLDELPTVGNRHNVFLAVITMASYQALLDRGVTSDYAKTLFADIGWKIYCWLLGIVAFPFHLVVKDPGKRMEKILRTLMIFPFSAPGKPGYEVRVWSEGGDTYTHWTHCPPHAFVQRLITTDGNRGELDAFSQSWCRYDWAGADLLANDGKRGHYSRPHTMSRGDSVCDMCWHGRGSGACDAAGSAR